MFDSFKAYATDWYPVLTSLLPYLSVLAYASGVLKSLKRAIKALISPAVSVLIFFLAYYIVGEMGIANPNRLYVLGFFAVIALVVTLRSLGTISRIAKKEVKRAIRRY